MANRRMLAKSISVSEQVAALRDDFTRLLFTWMIAHADDWGVLPGSAARIRAIVVPMLKCTTARVENALNDMEKHHLIWRYSADDQPWLQFRKWEEHQEGLHKRTNPKNPRHCDVFPEVPGSSEKVPASRARAELNGTEGNGTEEKENAQARESLSLSSSSPLPDPDAERTADVAIFSAWCDATGRDVKMFSERRSWMGKIHELRVGEGLSPPGVAPLIAQYRAKMGNDKNPSPGQVVGVYSQLIGLQANGHHPNGPGAAGQATDKRSSDEAEEAASRARFHAKTAVVREFAGGNLPTG